MSDLDKLMKKLKKEDKPTEDTKEDLDIKDEDLEEDEVKETAQKDIETPKEDDLKEKSPAQQEKVEESEPIPANESNEQGVDHEVAVLQNNGVFRRELLLTLKELVDVHKANTQTLIDLKNKFDEADGTKKE